MACLSKVTEFLVGMELTDIDKKLIQRICTICNGWWQMAASGYLHHRAVRDKLAEVKRKCEDLYESRRALVFKLANANEPVEKIIALIEAQSEEDAERERSEIEKRRSLRNREAVKKMLEALDAFDSEQTDFAEELIERHEKNIVAMLEAMEFLVPARQQMEIAEAIRAGKNPRDAADATRGAVKSTTPPA